ncbi:gamma-interferon-inducible lysosomal thiol reductase-like [Antennarius striatus]|uniref:gamma-interferon-inducible lysosomal thiol reductase-like n=1 Tax=Antennarius striatus TaxID=241820 RepID=UPI0035B049C0
MKGPTLLILMIWFHVQSGGGVHSPSCNLPPSKWCSSVDSALRCGVLKECLKSNSTRSQQTADPVRVGVYYETLCPDSVNFLTKMFFPTWILLNDIMSVTLVPYGNAQEKSDGQRYIFICQHGKQECLGNMIQACLLNMTDKAFPIISCMESSSHVIKAAKSCADLFATELEWGSIMKCVHGDLGNQLMHQNALKTNALMPTHKFVPWVTINGGHTDELQNKAESSLFTLVCSTFKGARTVACGGSQRQYKSYNHNEGRAAL